MAQHPLIVSYYTPATHYEARANALRRSIDKLGLQHRIEPRPDRGSWAANCAQKSEFVDEMRREVKAPIIWLDADAVLMRPIPELDGFQGDFAAIRLDGWNVKGGQLYFGTGPAADRLVETWCQYCQQAPHIFDQVTLGYAWWETALEMPIDVRWLPGSAFAKPRNGVLGRLRFWFQRPDVSILQHKESRRSRRLQAETLRPVVDHRSIPEWWRAAARQNKPFPLSQAQRHELGL